MSPQSIPFLSPFCTVADAADMFLCVLVTGPAPQVAIIVAVILKCFWCCKRLRRLPSFMVKHPLIC